MYDGRVKRMIYLFPNASDRIVCKLCSISFANPLKFGSSIVTKVCPGCCSTMSPKYSKSKSPKKEKLLQPPNSVALLSEWV
jgi:hypothetical protein